MRTLGRWIGGAPGALVPAVVLAQGADGAGAATGASAWNWVVGIAALIVVLFLARVMFGRRAGRPARRP